MSLLSKCLWFAAVGMTGLGFSAAAETAIWEVPLGGNAYLTKSADGSPDRVDGSGVTRWQDDESRFSIYFRTTRDAVLDLALRLRVPEGESAIRVAAAGRVFEKTITGAEVHEVALGRVRVKAAGYVTVDFQGVMKDGPVFAGVSELLVASETPDLNLAFVKDNEGNRFYWGRRGPSVHLSYEPPAGKDVEYFYNEITVPEGEDPAGSYYMANGFGEGYFGMQSKGGGKRWVLFSVWSPFSTNNPKEIPEEDRVVLLARGKDVHGGKFGGEGSGGQSYLIYPWKSGTTYGFLNRVRPDGEGNSIYSAWFYAPEKRKWQLIASFRRPKTDKHLTGMHSFLENFHDRDGYRGRMAWYGNQWARDTDGKWHSLTKARFTGDDIANRGYRMDFAGGVAKGRFFMRNGGFFAKPVKLGSRFERKPSRAKPPVIDLDALEGNL